VVLRKQRNKNFIMIRTRHTTPRTCLTFRNNLSWKIARPQSIHRHFSQIKSSTATAADDLRDQLSGFKTFDNTPAIFPWRHSNELLPRVDPTSREYNPYGPAVIMKFPDTLFAHGVCARMLGSSYWDIITNKWEKDLCQNFTWAFGRATAGLISHTFHVPIDYTLEHEETSVAQHDINVDYESSLKVDVNDNKKDDEQKKIQSDNLAQQMLEKSLLELYTNAVKHSKPTIQLRLQTRPISAKFLSTNVMIYSRDMVNKVPELKGLWKKPTDQIFDFVYDNMMLFSTGGEFTVICQVLIHCKEIFWVKDETGRVLQGEESDVEKDVVHVVRFEIPCRYSDSSRPYFEPGSWVITDWDDLLKGNIYF